MSTQKSWVAYLDGLVVTPPLTRLMVLNYYLDIHVVRGMSLSIILRFSPIYSLA